MTDDLAHAQTALADLLAVLGPDDWSRPSPCDDWDVTAVVRHVVVGERVFATSLRGCRDDLQVVTDGVEAIPTSDLAATYADGSAALRDALDAADPESTCPTGLGPMPPAVVGRLRTVEALVHGWDVRRAADLGWTVDDAVVERAHRSSVALLDRLPPGRTPFAPPREVASDAPAMHRLVALLGRRPDGPGSPQA